MPIMEFSFSPTSSVKLMWFSSKMTKWNKNQNLASQLAVIRFFRILRTDFKSLLSLLKRILTTENHNDNIYFHLLGGKMFLTELIQDPRRNLQGKQIILPKSWKQSLKISFLLKWTQQPYLNGHDIWYDMIWYY